MIWPTPLLQCFCKCLCGIRPRICFIHILRRQTSTNCLSLSLGANSVPKHCCSPSPAGGWLLLPGSFQMGHRQKYLTLASSFSLFPLSLHRCKSVSSILFFFFFLMEHIWRMPCRKTAVEIFFLFSWQHVKRLTMNRTALVIKLVEFKSD